MKIKPGTPLLITLAFSPTHTIPVGRLAMSRGVAYLEYSSEFHRFRIEANPLSPQPTKQLVPAPEPEIDNNCTAYLPIAYLTHGEQNYYDAEHSPAISTLGH
jgi:hypothetical protein